MNLILNDRKWPSEITHYLISSKNHSILVANIHLISAVSFFADNELLYKILSNDIPPLVISRDFNIPHDDEFEY